MKFQVTVFKIASVAVMSVEATGFVEAAELARKSPVDWKAPEEDLKLEVRREDEIPINTEPLKVKREENKSIRRTK